MENKPDVVEDLFNENSSRWVLFPIHYPQIWEMYKIIMQTFWTSEDFKFDKTTLGLVESSETSQQALVDAVGKYATDVIAMFGTPSQIHGFLDITELTSAFIEKIQAPEARAFLGFESSFENIHRETISQWIVECKGPIMDFKMSEGMKRYLEFLQKNLGSWYSNVPGDSSVGDRMILIDGNLDTENQHEGNINKSTQNEIEMNPDEKDNLARILATIVCMKSFQLTGLWMLSKLLNESPFKKSAGLIHRDCILHAAFASLIYNSLIQKLSDEQVSKLVEQCAAIHTTILEDDFEKIPALEKEIQNAVQSVSRWATNTLGGSKATKDNAPRDWVLPEWVLESRHKPFKTDTVAADETTAAKAAPADQTLSLDPEF